MFYSRQSCIQAGTLFLICLMVLTQSVNVDGKSYDGQVQQNFNLSDYQGRWWMQKYPKAIDVSFKCVSENFIKDPTTGIVTGEVRAIEKGLDQKMDGSFTVLQNDPAKYEGKMTIVGQFAGYELNTTYWVLSTDYNTYSIEYSCDDDEKDEIYVLSRQQTFDTEKRKEAFFTNTNNILASLGFASYELVDVDNEDCTIKI